jgi:hypothetical protein
MERIHEGKKMARSDISKKIKKSQKRSTLKGHPGTSKPYIKNPFYYILVNIPRK